MANLSKEEFDTPDMRWDASNSVHRQSWVQRALASAERLGVPKDRMKSMQPGFFLIIQEQRQDEHGAEA